MVKSDLIKAIQTQVCVSPFTAKAVIDEVINQITLALAKGDDVTLRGLGAFKILHKKERMGRNPKTGKDALISARAVVSFKAGGLLADKVKNSNPS